MVCESCWSDESRGIGFVGGFVCVEVVVPCSRGI